MGSFGHGGSYSNSNATRFNGFYPETLARYMTLFAAPPGRDHYEVVVADLPAPVTR